MQTAVISSQLSRRFLLKSSSVILRFCSSRSLSTVAIQAASNITIQSSRTSASCLRIFSKPTSSTVLPLIWISFPVAAISSALVEAYLFFKASKKLADLSLGLEGRMKDAVVGEALRPDPSPNESLQLECGNLDH